MTTTIRAARHLLATITAPAIRQHARAVEDYEAESHYQRMDYPVCDLERLAQEALDRPAFEASLYVAQANAWATVQALYAADAGADDIAEARNDALEIDKEIRKSIWYYDPNPSCRCADCQPLTRPVAIVQDLPSAHDLMGEQGADW